MLAQLTKEGCHVLGEFGYESDNRIRQYGLIHEFWRDKVKRYYKKLGYEVTAERKLNGERTDLAAAKGEERIAIEIETGNSNAIGNIKKCLDAGFSTVISVPVNRQIEGQIKEKLRKETLDQDRRVVVISSGKFE